TAVGFSHWLMILESVGLAIILVGSVILNSATCVIISRDSALRRKPTNLLVANLCVANMVLTVGVIPFSLISLISDRHGTFLGPACTTNGLFSVASCGAIVLTLCCISIDRYIAVCKPVRYRTIVTPRRALLMILITWIQAFLYGSLPVLGWSRYEYHPGTLHCSPAWTDGCSLYIFLSTTGFAIPLTVMAVTYTRIFLEIRKHSRKINILQMRAKFPAQEGGATTVRTERRAQSQLPREYKVARTGLILLLLFLFHWLPYLVVHSCSTRVDASEGVFHAVMWMVYLNGVVNPVTYALSNSSVKAKLKLL
ncbi:predicted protein, partial [Nematostella vectensis]